MDYELDRFFSAQEEESKIESTCDAIAEGLLWGTLVDSTLSENGFTALDEMIVFCFDMDFRGWREIGFLKSLVYHTYRENLSKLRKGEPFQKTKLFLCDGIVIDRLALGLFRGYLSDNVLSEENEMNHLQQIISTLYLYDEPSKVADIEAAVKSKALALEGGSYIQEPRNSTFRSFNFSTDTI